MFRKILSILVAIFMFLPNAHSAEMVNVEYIHQYLNARWGIDLPYGPELTNPRVAANMKYLLTVVDIANEYLNGDKTTDYGNSEYATLAAADTVATNTAIDTLIDAPTFTITTTPNTSSFSMKIGAAGNFIIDWGDGKRDVIANKPTGATTYSHTYTTSGEYEIKLSGRATGYSDAATDAAVSFFPNASNARSISKISGSLGKIFPTLPDGSQPRFYRTFYYASNLTEIPENLFAGIQGAPASSMFNNTFYNCSQLQSIPVGLFAGIRGAPAESMFAETFRNTAITEIPADLFAGIQGAPAERMFYFTFSDTAITSIPANLFGTLNGDGAPSMFYNTFSGCKNLTTVDGPLFSGTITPAEKMFFHTFFNTAITSIPANLFGTLNGDGAPSMFEGTFYGCKNLTTVDGPLFSGTLTPAESMFAEMFYNSTITSIPENIFGNLTGDGAPSMFEQTFYWCKNLTTIERPLFSGTITPAERMFSYTFSNTAITSIPDGLFAGIQGAPAGMMFSGTFNNTALTEIPADLFAGIQGAPAESMFNTTFAYTPITSIPENLFAGISGPAATNMFVSTFAGCHSLTGPSARTNGQYLYEIWPNVSYMYTYSGATGLSDYDQIPDNWK